MAAKNQVARVERMPALPENPTTMQVIAMASRDEKVDIDKFKALTAMKREDDQILAKLAFDRALTRAQTDMEPVVKDARGDKQIKYASYAAIDAMVRPIYLRCGFNISYDTGDPPSPDMVRVIAYVTHNKGHTRPYKFDMPADGKGAKGGDVLTRTHAAGSAATYGRRYLLSMIFNIVIVDDDGKAAGTVQKQNEAVSEEQLDQMMHRMAQVGMPAQHLIARLKETTGLEIEAVKDCPAYLWDKIMKSLETYGKKAEAAEKQKTA